MPTGWRPPVYEHTITATMRTFVMVAAPTYAEALRHLLAQWTPNTAAPRRALQSGHDTPAIDAVG